MSETADIAISLKNINKTFFIREKATRSIRDILFNALTRNPLRAIHALNDINLTVDKGEIFGIIGNNGSGKSTLLKIITKSINPNKGGELIVSGRVLKLALGLGFDRTMSARDNIYINGSIIGLTFKQIGQRFEEILRFAELEDFVDTPVRFFSKGMVSRLSFAIAVHAKADILLLDEFFGGVGDAGFKRKSDAYFRENLINKEQTIVIVSHRPKIIKQYCKRVLVLKNGKQIYLGEPNEAIKIYKQL